MTMYPNDDPASPTTPIFDQTVSATAVHVDGEHADGSSTSEARDRGAQAADTVKGAAGQAGDTAKQAAGQAKDQAQQVGSTAKDQAKQVGATTKDQASRVASDAVGQARELYGQATEQLSEQAGKQQKNAASALHTLRDDLAQMHERDDNGGLAAELVQTVSQRAGAVADWLQDREPGEVFDEVKQFAARRPGLFIGIAAISGIVAARAVKALTADAKHDAAADRGPGSAPRQNVPQVHRASAQRVDGRAPSSDDRDYDYDLDASRPAGLGDFR